MKRQIPLIGLILGLIVLTTAPVFGRVAATAVLPPDVNGVGGGWGVGFITLPLSPESVYGPLSVNQITVTSPDKRVFYPSFEFSAPDPKTKEILTERGVLPPFVQGIVRQAMDNATPQCKIYFLFSGTSAIQINIGSRPPQAFTIIPQNNPQAYPELLNQWLARYFADVNKKRFELSPGTSPVLRNYLRSMLVYRMGLNPQSIAPVGSAWDSVSPLNFMAATPALRAKMPYESFFADQTLYNVSFDELLANSKKMESELTSDEKESNGKNQDKKSQPFDGRKILNLMPIPDNLNLSRDILDAEIANDSIPVEEIAMRVPKNCFYMRFGNYENFSWFQNFNKAANGDFNSLVASQSVDRNNDDKLQTMLASKEDEMSRLMGPTVIKDVAFIGADMFIDDGPSFGILFQANNSYLLSSGISGQRAAYLKKNPDAKEKTVVIAGKKVKFLSTPDRRIHAYYAVDGMFHLISTSRTVVEDFLKTANPKESLGGEKKFKIARQLMPEKNDYTVYFYASEDFLYRLLSPEYWTEIIRRRRSAAEIEMTILARLTAKNEGYDNLSIEQLVQYGYLPKSVLIRPDGGRLAVDEKARIYDTKRGYAGLFRSAADMKVESVTEYELNQFESMRNNFNKKIIQLNPLIVGLTRQQMENGAERLFIDARIAPFAKVNFERTKQYFGPADSVRLAPIPGNCMAAEAILNDSRLSIGLREQVPYQGPTGRPVADILNGIFGNDLGLYFGTTNERGFLGLLGTFNLAPMSTGTQYSVNSQADMAMRERDYYIKLFSFKPEIPPQVGPYLTYENAPSKQQVWITVNDPMTVPIGYKINNMMYALGARTTLHNITMLHTLVQQLGVPADKAKEIAENLFEAELISPINGKYVYVQTSPTTGFWTDTALGAATTRNLGWFSVQAPQGYIAQPWNWFRGGDFRFCILPEGFQFSATVDLSLKK